MTRFSSTYGPGDDTCVSSADEPGDDMVQFYLWAGG